MQKMQEIRVETLMTKAVHCIGQETTLEEAIHLMKKNACSCLVITENKCPVGIVTERDMVRILSELLERPILPSPNVSESMSSPPVVLKLDATLFEALVLVQARKIRHIPKDPSYSYC